MTIAITSSIAAQLVTTGAGVGALVGIALVLVALAVGRG